MDRRTGGFDAQAMVFALANHAQSAGAEPGLSQWLRPQPSPSPSDLPTPWRDTFSEEGAAVVGIIEADALLSLRLQKGWEQVGPVRREDERSAQVRQDEKQLSELKGLVETQHAELLRRLDRIEAQLAGRMCGGGADRHVLTSAAWADASSIGDGPQVRQALHVLELFAAEAATRNLSGSPPLRLTEAIQHRVEI